MTTLEAGDTLKVTENSVTLESTVNMTSNQPINIPLAVVGTKAAQDLSNRASDLELFSLAAFMMEDPESAPLLIVNALIKRVAGKPVLTQTKNP